MPSRRLSPLRALEVHLDAIAARNAYTHDPAPIVAEMRQVAGEHVDALAEIAGRWAGFHSSVRESRPLVDALLSIGNPDAVELGRDRAAQRRHDTTGVDPPKRRT